MSPIKLIRSPFEILPDFPVPSMLDMSIFFSSTIFRTAGDKCCLVLGGIYFSFFATFAPSSARIFRTKAPLESLSFDSSIRVRGSSFSEIVFFYFL